MCVEYAAPWRRSTRARAWISAPAASASSSRRSIAASSSAVSGRLSSPAVIRRSVLWPTWRITFTEVGGKPATYSAKVVSRKGSQVALEARYSRSIADWPGSAGATEKPQLPTTSSVTPWRIFDSARWFSGRVKSECVWMSMNPGATTWPRASIARRAGRVERGSMARMRPFPMETSASRPTAPLPSTTWPPRTIRSSMAILQPAANIDRDRHVVRDDGLRADGERDPQLGRAVRREDVDRAGRLGRLHEHGGGQGAHRHRQSRARRQLAQLLHLLVRRRRPAEREEGERAGHAGCQVEGEGVLDRDRRVSMAEWGALAGCSFPLFDSPVTERQAPSPSL